MDGMGMGGMWAWLWVWPLLILVGLVLIVWVVVRLVHDAQQRSSAPASAGAQPTARRILDERLARGEIDVEEYQRRRDLLG